MKRRATYTTAPWRSDYFVVRGIDQFVNAALDDLVTRDQSVVDVGCGAAPFQGRIEGLGARYIPCDIAMGAARVVCTCEALALRDRSADLVLCTEVLEHVRSMPQSLAEIARVLRPGGVLVATTPFLIRLHEEPWDFRRPTLHELRAHLDTAGFDIDKLDKLGDEGEVIATVLDGALLGMRPATPVVRQLFDVGRGIVRLVANGLAAATTRALRSSLPRTAYLGHGLVARRR